MRIKCSEDECVLSRRPSPKIFLLIRVNLESQIPLGSLTFPMVENPWGTNLNNYLVIYEGFSILGVPPLALNNHTTGWINYLNNNACES